jgi:hypothetical protein
MYTCFCKFIDRCSADGNITDMVISDSAPALLKDEFESVKKSINIQSIKSLIAKINLKNAGIIIPVFYVYGSDYCTNSFADFLLTGYLTFKSKSYDKLTITLNPIFVSFYKPVN